MSAKKQPMPERFWSKVDKGVNDDTCCWNWLGQTGTGYGRFWLNESKRNIQAHHFSIGVDIPPGHQAFHQCDNRKCVRPSHIFIGKKSDNKGLRRPSGLLGPGHLDSYHEYRAWNGAKERCFNPRNKSFPRYGGRGITMCEEWKMSSEKFLQDMGRCPVGYSLHRINNDGSYSPNNCRWASATEQMNNMSRNVRLNFNGSILTVTEWGIATGIGRTTIRMRLKTGWSVQKALTTPVRYRPRRQVQWQEAK